MRDAHWLVLSAVLAGAAGLALQAMVANLLSIADLGLYALIVGVYSIVAAGSAIGLDAMVMRWSAAFLGESGSPSIAHKRQLADKVGGALMIVAATSGVAAACLLVVVWGWPDLVGSEEASQACLVLVPAAVVFSLNKVITSVLMGLREIFSFAAIRVARALILIAVTSLVLLSSDASVMAALVAYPIAEALLFVYLIGRLLRRELVRVPARHSLPWSACKAGAFISVTTLLAELGKQLPVVVAAFWLSLEATGEVAFLVAVSQVMLLVSAAVSSNVNPIIAARWSHGQRDELLGEMSRIFRVMILTAPILLVGAVFVYYSLSALIMPARYVDLALIFAGFALAASLRHALAWPGFMLVLMDRAKSNTLRVVITLVLSALLLSIGAVLAELSGLAVAMVAAVAIQVYLLHIFVKWGIAIDLLGLAVKSLVKPQ